MGAPSEADQLRFLDQLQRLLSEGSFSASYKYALLLAIADLSVERPVERGGDPGAPMRIPIKLIAEKFIAYYWRQAVPYTAPGTKRSGILKQNNGEQAAILQIIESTRKASGGSLQRAKQNRPAWAQLLKKATQTVKGMPLWKLQNIGQETMNFLYENQNKADHIELKPGVAFCFRQFYSLIDDMVRGAWVRFIRGVRDNQPLLRQLTDLDEFLFGSERANLSSYRPILEPLQNGRCFYCDNTLRENPQVDHFVPWARYPVDLGHNFILVHGKCNNAKKERLAAYEHLKRWCQRNEQHGNRLADEFSKRGLVHDLVASQRITGWAYEQTAATGGHVWLKRDVLVPLDAGWQELPGLVA